MAYLFVQYIEAKKTTKKVAQKSTTPTPVIASTAEAQ